MDSTETKMETKIGDCAGSKRRRIEHIEIRSRKALVIGSAVLRDTVVGPVAFGGAVESVDCGS